MNKDCLFCKIIQQEIPSQCVYEDDVVYAFHDINACAPVHVLIVPKKHIAKVSDMSETDSLVMGKLLYAAKCIADQLHITEGGYRLVVNNGAAAGQEVFHVHVHLLGGRDFKWPPG